MTVLYTGHGGRDAESKRQVGHQSLTRGNLALATNKLSGLPVRLIRGAMLSSPHAPATGYRYDGLYRVVDYWRQQGRSGFFIWKFHLEKIPAIPSALATAQLYTSYETEAARQVKALYHYRCQVCRIRLIGSAGPYAETIYLRPLAAPHNGPDAPENLLCLCPNHRILFEVGGIALADDFSLLGQGGQLMVDFRHAINREHLRYRREHYPLDPDAEG